MSDDFQFIQSVDEPGDSVEAEVTTAGDEQTVYVTPSRSSKKSKSDPVPPQSWHENTTSSVRIINKHQHDGKYVVQDADTGKVHLVPAEKLVYSVKDQPLSTRDFEEGEEPYNWDEEIAALSASPEAIRLALWRKGLLRKEDAPNLKAVLRELLSQSVFPISKEG